MINDSDAEIEYFVVINEEEQYSIWPSFKKIPMGWEEEGFRGSKQSCLDHIGKVWKDMRPLNLRTRMDSKKKEVEKLAREIELLPDEPLPTSSTVEFLLKEEHPLRVHPSQATIPEFKRALEMGSIHILITDTKGQTCLRMDFPKNHQDERSLCDEIQLNGSLELDFIPLSLDVKINMSSMEGVASFKKRRSI